MQMWAEFSSARNYFDDPVVQLFGVERAYPHPVERASLRDHFEQVCELDRRIEVLAVAAQMYASEHDFLEAARMKIVERRHHAARLDAARGAARERHDTECTELIASFLQLQERTRVAVQRDRGQLDRGPPFAQ